jgi:hypothetical protein
VLSSTSDWINIGLLACGGAEEMSHVSGARTTVLHSYLDERTASSP